MVYELGVRLRQKRESELRCCFICKLVRVKAAENIIELSPRHDTALV